MKAKVESLTGLYDYIVTEKKVFEELDNNCERTKNEVYEDDDFNEFLESLLAEVITREPHRAILSDGVIVLEVDLEVRANRFGDFGDDTVFLFDTLKKLGE